MTDTHNLKRLVDALRSKEFKQTYGRLKIENILEQDPEPHYCCLGVATELCRRENPDRLKWGKDHKSVIMDTITTEKEYFALLPVVRNWLTGTTVPGMLVIQKKTIKKLFPATYKKLTGISGPVVALDILNDVGFTFSQIADLLEVEFITKGTT